ncbi:EAL domain-containing protein [Sphingomonas bacterium]|uniref:EAL domain-containing protein n=1 Tax=Sphingomonas bacterium TaxID=1895847 RepID=UPI0020C5CBA8|nr:EAL domain-containing protein [Sphingomonas bacterium]
MPGNPSSSEPFARRIAATLRVLGLREDVRDAAVEMHLTKFRRVAMIWPVSLCAVIGGAAVAVTAALVEQSAVIDIAALSGTVLAVSGVILWLLRGPATTEHVVHRRMRALVVATAVLGGTLLGLAWTVGQLPGGDWEQAGVAAAAGALIAVSVAVVPVRAGTLGLGAGLIVALAAKSPGMTLPLTALPFFACVAVGLMRLGRTDLRQALERAAEASEGRFAAKMVAEFEGQGTGWFWETDRHGRVTYLSPQVAAEMSAPGANGADGGGTPALLTDLFRMDSTTPGTERTLAFHLSSRTSFSEYSVCAARTGMDGSESGRWWSMSGRPVVDDLGRFQGFIGSGTDLTEKRKSEAEITRLALFDGLTGLANRQRMHLSLDKTLNQKAGPYRATALFLMDLDRFKAVNDTLGHPAGDALLKQVAQRLQRGVGDQGLVGRLGGDEFQVVLPGMDAREPLSVLARDLIASLSQPYFIAGTSVTIGCSIGIAIAPEHGEDSETLTRNADLALYAAKADGRGVHRFYSDEMLAGAQSRALLEDDLRHALGTGAFHLAYQPVVATKDVRIVGYEALLRWDHPTRGSVSPAMFVPVAEECGLIEQIGEWVLRTACHAAARWPHDVRVAVNVSPIQFANPKLPAIVASALAASGIAAARLELEITEGVFLDESASSERMFRALKALGVRLALDDFGTGYSSLGYLRSAPFDKIKIDQSFVRGAVMPGNRNAAIIKAIVTLADTLGMETTAEGVEIQDEIELVRELGCSHIQGYVYGRGMPAAAVEEQLAGGGLATPIGHKVSRAPRTKMLRSARMAIGQVVGDVRIRDISPGGAMIDGIEIDGEPGGIDVLIELLEDQMFAARIRWAKDGKAGIEFAESFALDRLNAVDRTVRRAG